MLSPLHNLWYRYKNLVETAVYVTGPQPVKDVGYWRKKLFANIIIYTIPISLLAAIPSIIISFSHKYTLIPAFDVFALLSLVVITLNSRLSLTFRKAYIVMIVYVLAIIVIASLGEFGVGSIYLLAISVFIALLFNQRVVLWSVFANILIYAVFALIIYFKLFNSPLIIRYSVSFWAAYSCNFLFLNLIVVLELRHIIGGLEGTVAEEAGLRIALQREAAERIKRNELLAESEGHYRSLFCLNPSPMWIYDRDTLKFLQVNEAAVDKYGYSEQEFLNMTIKDIRPESTINQLFEILKNKCETPDPSHSDVEHLDKQGRRFFVEVICSTISFMGRNARLVIARDITAQKQHIEAIDNQNKKLREVTYLQSHVVRAPLSRILGLVDLITLDKNEKPDKNMMEYLDMSARELDSVIKAIIDTIANEGMVE